MQINLSFESELSGYTATAEQSLTHTLARFADSIEWIRVRAQDINSHKGGVDKLCRLTAQLKEGDLITVSDRQVTIGAAVAGMEEKAVAAIGRILERKRKRRFTSSMSGFMHSFNADEESEDLNGNS